jgi:hypothetical protein
MSFGAIAEAVGFQSARGVALILRNTCWKGIRTFNPNGSRTVAMEKSMDIAPLISAEKWAQAQAILDQKRTKPRARKRQEHSLGLGLLRCQCGRLHYLRRDYRPGQHDLFYCASRVRGNDCGAASIRRTVADVAVVDAITDLSNVKTAPALMEQALSKPASKPPSAVSTQREIARVTGEQEPLIDLRIKGKITEEQFDAIWKRNCPSLSRS